ncbi:MAG: pyridoxal phosphate-dependent aminotransferase [Gemmatimonadetes bacterium]|nr:MAG: pyridoxal phosphate-dependent aminotransferase [Gemmatimonadota bacterium]
MILSQIAQQINPSPTLKLNAKAAVLRQAGEPVIHLGGGEPKSKASPDAINATIAHLETGEIRYAAVGGIPELKQAIIDYTEQHYHRLVEPANVIASSGAKQALMVGLQAILNPQDEVIFPVPYWVSYPEMVKLAYGVPVPVTPAGGSLYPTIQDIEKKVTANTKVILINSPNNPSGVVYPTGVIADLVDFCEKREIFLIMDDIYHQLVFDGQKAPSGYEFTKKSVDESKLLVINGVSKLYAMTGFRLGWAIGNRELIAAMTRIQAHQTSGSSILAQKGAIGALTGDQSCVRALRSTLETHRDILLAELAEIPNLKVQKPEGTFYSFVDFRAYEADSRQLSDFLIENVLVLAVPGVDFGMDGYLRLSFCGSEADIREGIRRIRWALDPNQTEPLTIGNRQVVKTW